MYKVQFLCSPPLFLDGYKNMTETTDIKSTRPQYMINIFMGEKGWWMVRGGGGRGSSEDVKVGKGESCSEGGLEGVTTPAPWKILIIQSPL